MRTIFICLILILTASASFAQAAAPSCSQVFSGQERVPRFLQYAVNFNKAFMNYYQTETRVSHFRYEVTAADKTKRVFQTIYNTPLQVILPVSTRRVLSWEAPANKIFVKLWRDRNYQPTAQEWATLKKYEAEVEYKERQQFLKSHRGWHRFRKSLSMVHSGSLLAFFLLQSYFTAESVDNSVNAATYLDETGDNIVELLNESVPFPHIALRIGRHVYSYGFEKMSVSTLSEYFYSKQMTPVTSKMGKLAASPKRTLQVIRLNLTKEEIKKLRQELEIHAGKSYKNIFLVNDCSSMIIRALTKTTSLKIPATIDMSPMAVFSYLTLAKMKGDPKVGLLRQVATEQDELKKSTAARNLWINSMEAKLWMHLMPFNFPLRMTMNLALDEKEIQDFDPVQQAYIEQYFHEVRQDIEDTLEVQGLRIQAAEKSVSATEIEGVIALLQETHLETFKGQNETQVSILTAQYSIEALNQIKNELLIQIKGEGL